MARDTLTGSRIRDRRGISGLRQAELARRVGISASYLNLIEHNRRRIGGKLLLDIAQTLGVEPSMLTEGAEAALIAALREVAADAGVHDPEVARADEFAGRFPAWAEVLSHAHRRIRNLERTVETLADRLTHDPYLAASLHEMLSTAAAIRSTASILAEPGEIAPEWLGRFHRNLNEDSLRLADSSKALVGYLDASSDTEAGTVSPQETVEAFFAARDYHFPELEEGRAEPSALVSAAPELRIAAARKIATKALSVYAADAQALPLDMLRAALDSAVMPDPLTLARRTGTSLPRILRRLATLPGDMLPAPVGLVVADASGSILLQRPVDGFAVPRFGASCPLWPLFTALTRPHVPLRRTVMQLGRGGSVFDAVAITEPATPPDYGAEPLYQSTMLLIPKTVARNGDEMLAEARQEVGSSCRVCPANACDARREPSILSEGF